MQKPKLFERTMKIRLAIITYCSYRAPFQRIERRIAGLAIVRSTPPTIGNPLLVNVAETNLSKSKHSMSDLISSRKSYNFSEIPQVEYL